MSSRLHSKPSRPWERSSPGRRRPGGEKGSPPKDHYRRKELGSPERSKRGRWESPLKNRLESPGRMRRRGFESPPRSGRRDLGSPRSRRRLEDESHRADGNYHFHANYQERHKEGKCPAGLVFLCSSSTLRDCFHFRVLGLPAAQRDIVERVVPGTKLFLFNFDTKELHGVFEAASRGGFNLVPEAFQDSKGSYAAQVHFNFLRECRPLPDDLSRDVLRENFIQGSKFDCELSPHQVHKIIQLFSSMEIRPEHGGGLSWDRDRLGEERNFLNEVHPVELDAGRFPPLLQSHFFRDRNGFPELHSLLNRPLPDSIPDPSVVLARDAVDEVDQLALKYLRNEPGFAGIRLEPVNTSLLSTSLKSDTQLGFFDPHDKNFPGVSFQYNGLPHAFPVGATGTPDSRILGHSDMTNRDETELPINDGGKLMSDNLPGSQRGLLPLPPQVPTAGISQPFGMQHQPGMMYPTHTLTGAFPGSGQLGLPLLPGPGVGVRPDINGPLLPFHPLQGPRIVPSPHLLNHPQMSQSVNHPQTVNHINNRQQQSSAKISKKSKKNKQKKKFQGQKAGRGNEDKSHNAHADAD